jgi:YVTN family beta-propeller protein
VCLSRNNSVGIVDLDTGKLVKEILVGVAPYAVILNPADGRAYVSNWGGQRPEKGQRTALSSDTPTSVDERGIADSGSVACIDLSTGKVIAEVAVGLHPAGMALAHNQRALYVANANSDSVSVIDTKAMQVRHTVVVRPDAALPFGSAPNALTLSSDEKRLFVANAGNNAVAVLDVNQTGRPPSVAGFIPTGWYPGAIITDEKSLYIANVKGDGTPSKMPGKDRWTVTRYHGTVNKVPIPSDSELARHTAEVHAAGQFPHILKSLERMQSGEKPVPVPRRLGAPSVFEHVVYVIKENRTYDQVFGDIKEGNGDPHLCIYGDSITPNQHALAREFVLLDNYYCNGVCSADGHAWATEGYVTDHLEKSFGGFTRSYTWGDDPLGYSSSGFIWDNVLAHGLSLRNYGEMDYAEPVPKETTFAQIYQDYRSGAGKIPFTQSIGIERLRHYTAPGYPGWNLKITDGQRVDRFLAEFHKAEKSRDWPNFVLVFLPQDHTAGASTGSPTPRACVADNDLALGRLVEAISHSKFWPKTCIFVIEDDPQDGFDHVDGHRSTCLVVSPYAKRKQVISHFYNQTSVLHTMERILGLPPMNQMDALAPLMDDCFTDKPDLTPYALRPNSTPLNEMNPDVSQLPAKEASWALRSQKLDFTRNDEADEDTLNRVLWHAARGVAVPYPVHLAGAHGRGLRSLKLRLAATPK